MRETIDKAIHLETRPYTDTDAEWDEFVAHHPHGSILQTTHWAMLKGRFGWTPQRVWLRHEGKLIAGAQLLIRSVAFGLVKMAYIPHGPLVDWADDEMVDVLLNQIDLAAYRNRAGILKMEPLLWQDEISPERWSGLAQKYELLTETDSIQPPRTMLIDLRPQPDDILGSFKQKTRYNIRLAAKKGVTVREGTAQDIPAFNQLMRTTGQRNEFGVHAPEYYRDAFDLFRPEQRTLLLAEYEGKPLAGAMIFVCGRMATFLFGGSSNEERERMPTYAIQWAAIEWARAQGCHWYDLWGVPDAEPDEMESQFEGRDDGLWGVYRFKRGFNGLIRRTVGPADRVYNRLVHRLYQRRRGR
ncbi:MAG: peptidoglycan bridge formation glycyltransferase FemA/FemB family protein [Chloroflexi bacterium]|nr:peptidoglycan bridge formation glycyltransferase FemA/FemB family protein [Chloroflexota bacterium]